MARLTPIRRPDSPQGRLDILLMRLAEYGTHVLERKLSGIAGESVDLWHGPDGFEGLTREGIEYLGVPGEPLTPRLVVLALCRKQSFMKKKRIQKGAA